MRIAIVNDTRIAVEALRRIIPKIPSASLAWTAFDGQDAVKKCEDDTPDLLLMDLIMPLMDGVAATREIMKKSPCPILIVTASIRKNSSRVFEALGAGALDAANMPSVSSDGSVDDAQELIRKIILLQRILGNSPKGQGKSVTEAKQPRSREMPYLVALGSSTGGPTALLDFLSVIPGSVSAAFVVVQHVDRQFAPGLASWLDSQCALEVRIAKEGDFPEPGKVFVAGTNDHLVISPEGNVLYTPFPHENPYRPSVDVFFSSLAANWRGKGAAVLMTGIGRDGAEGILSLRKAGWSTFAQDKESCVVYGMPKAAAELNAVDAMLPPSSIAAEILKLVSKSKES